VSPQNINSIPRFIEIFLNVIFCIEENLERWLVVNFGGVGSFVFWVCLVFFFILGLELSAFTLSRSTSPIFVKFFFKIRSHRPICPGWLQTAILLISASWVARITSVSHWHWLAVDLGFCFFETGFHYVAQAGFKFII
jgi:hypothetical protein